MTWTLVLVFSLGGAFSYGRGVHSQLIGFQTQAACEAAKAKAISDIGSGVNVNGTCIEVNK